MEAQEQPVAQEAAVRPKPKASLRFSKLQVKKATESNLQEFVEQEVPAEAPTLAVFSPKAPVAPKPTLVFGSAGPKAKAPKLPVTQTTQAEKPKPKPKPTVDVSQFAEDVALQEYATDILSEDAGNPYKISEENSVFPMRTRLGFQKQILNVFTDFIKIPEFGKAPDYDACKKLGAGPQQQLEMYEYQKFVREYVRQSSPYRGILVYHGLGSGKTCSAIAAAEALFSVSKKRIIVMTPFSLRDNFIREVSFCGFRHFRLQNHWVSLELSNPTIKLFATDVLGIPEAYLKKATKIWVPDFKLEPNFNGLPTDDRQEIVKQLAQQVTSRIQFINYNGISASALKEIACRPLDANGNGFFDDAVIIIDEIHNVTRLMQGTIEPYLTSLPGLRRKVPLEPITPGHWEPSLCKVTTDPTRPYLTNYKRGYSLYRLLQGARNSKIIGLSGTPLINFPEEIAILANLLGGYIHTASFTVTPASDVNKKTIEKILKDHVYVDFAEVELQGLNMSVLLTCLPEGMIKAIDTKNNALGIKRVPSDVKTPTITECVAEIIGLLGEKMQDA